jgi:hypothetical protein
MSEDEIPVSQHDRLAMAVAQGKSITAWARHNGVPRRTAQRWAAEPDYRMAELEEQVRARNGDATHPG